MFDRLSNGTAATEVAYSVYAQNEDDLDFLFQRCKRVDTHRVQTRFRLFFMCLLARMMQKPMPSSTPLFHEE